MKIVMELIRLLSSAYHPSNFLTTMTALCPPNPKALLTATRTFFSLALLGM